MTAKLITDNVLGKVMMDEFVGYDTLIGERNFDITSILKQRGVTFEDMCLNSIFRKLANTPNLRKTGIAAIQDEELKKVLYLYHVDTRDAGIIPAVFGATDIFPLDLDDIITRNSDFIQSTGAVEVVDEGHHEAVIHDLQNYTLPNRVYRHYKKAKSHLSLELINSERQFEDLYLRCPYTKIMDIHSALYYGGVIDDNTEDGRLSLYEDLYQRTHNIQEYIHSIISANVLSKGAYENYPLFRINYDGQLFAKATLHTKGNTWYWSNTDRLRLSSMKSEFNFNINDAVLCSLILHAQELGATTFNLGYAYYVYKDYYNPEYEWRKGLRFLPDHVPH